MADSITGTLLASAQRMADVGISTLPVGGPDGKRPRIGSWRDRQSTRPPSERLVEDYDDAAVTGVAMICGQVSGNIEMFEFEGEAVADGTHERFTDELRRQHPALAQSLEATWTDRTPTGGIHYYYRAETPVGGNQRLAARPPTDDEQAAAVDQGRPPPPLKVLIETRGEGGYSVVSPSRRPDFGDKPEAVSERWEAITGSPENVVTISDTQRIDLFRLARSFDATHPVKTHDDAEGWEDVGPAPLPTRSRSREVGDRPGDIFNREVSWFDVLVSRRRDGEKWTLARVDQDTDISYWRKPGSADPHHATTNARGTDRLTVFSTATAFDGQQHSDDGDWKYPTYSKFEAETVLGGYESPGMAADSLRREGFVAVSADVFISKKDGLLAKSFAEAIAGMGEIATDEGGGLWHFHEGVWVPGAGREIGARATALLGERFRPAHAKNAEVWFQAQPPFIKDDATTEFINTRNGLLLWETGELIAHTPTVPSINQIPVLWTPDAECPVVDEWIETVFPGDALETAWEVIGYSLYDGNPFHKAIALLGSGRNGKSTYLRLIERLVGRRNVSAVTVQSIAENRFKAAELHGKMANIAGDLDARALKHTDLFKMVAGEDPISAERKYGQPFDFTARAVPIWAMNELPKTADLTEGFFSKWHIIPFDVYLPDLPGGIDPTIEQRMWSELEGVLVRAVEGLRRLMARGGFADIDSVRQTKAEYIEYADPVATFLKEMVTADPEAFITNASLFTAFENWASDTGHKGMGRNKFLGRVRERLTQRGVSFNPKAKQSNLNGIAGIRLASSSFGSEAGR